MHEFKSLDILLSLAAEEAVSAGYAEITVAHLLIALARLGDPEAATPIDNAALRHEFEQLGIEPRLFRRRLRALLGNGGAGPPEGAIHRSTECKAVFALAEQIAARQGVALNPGYLLHATLISFGRIASQPGGGGLEIECPYCQSKMQPAFVSGVPHCAKCGKQIDVQAADQGPPLDAIPDEL